MKVFGRIVILMLILFPISNVFFQKAIQVPETLRYPNELKGFELMKTSKLKSLLPNISTEEDVIQALGRECVHSRKVPFGCKLDENWNVEFHYVLPIFGPLYTITFYPRHRISFSKVRFPKSFEKLNGHITHLPINVDKFLFYGDDYGLEYAVINQSGDRDYKKGDLFYIEYGLSKAELEVERQNRVDYDR